jgi:hypothetical protein
MVSVIKPLVTFKETGTYEGIVNFTSRSWFIEMTLFSFFGIKTTDVCALDLDYKDLAKEFSLAFEEVGEVPAMTSIGASCKEPRKKLSFRDRKFKVQFEGMIYPNFERRLFGGTESALFVVKVDRFLRIERLH